MFSLRRIHPQLHIKVFGRVRHYMSQSLMTNKAAAMPSVTKMRQISGRNTSGRVIMHIAQAVTPRPSTAAGIVNEVVIPVANEAVIPVVNEAVIPVIKEVVAPITNAVNVMVAAAADAMAAKAADTSM
jgi:hypothetical protein